MAAKTARRRPANENGGAPPDAVDGPAPANQTNKAAGRKQELADKRAQEKAAREQQKQTEDVQRALGSIGPAVLVLKVKDEEGNLQYVPKAVGGLEVDQIQTSLEMALKLHRTQLGLD